MRHPARWIVVAIAGATLQACATKEPEPAQASQTSQASTEKDVAAINAVQDREISLVATANPDSLVTAFASDVDFMPPDEPAIRGHDGLRKWAETMFSQGTMSGRYLSSEVTVSGDVAVARYVGELTMKMKAGGAPVTEHLKGIHVMKRQPDGSWKIVQDVWNADAPPAPPTSTAKSK